MQRRGFLGAILAAGIAPAIVHSPMKIFVPKQDIVLFEPWQGWSPSISVNINQDSFETWNPEEPLQYQLSEKIRVMAERLYRESNYHAVANALSNGLGQVPTMLLSSQAAIASYYGSPELSLPQIERKLK